MSTAARPSPRRAPKPPPSARSYGDPCGIARALDVIGERWALLVARELVLGPRRFTELMAGLTGVSRNVLSQRLRELESAGVVERRPGALYALSDWGLDLHPILLALGRWGARSPRTVAGGLGGDALMVALEATFQADKAKDLRATLELRIADQRYTATIDRGALAVTRGGPRRADAILASDAATLRAQVFGDATPASAPMAIEGDGRLARRFLRMFARPPTAQR